MAPEVCIRDFHLPHNPKKNRPRKHTTSLFLQCLKGVSVKVHGSHTPCIRIGTSPKPLRVEVSKTNPYVLCVSLSVVMVPSLLFTIFAATNRLLTILVSSEGPPSSRICLETSFRDTSHWSKSCVGTTPSYSSDRGRWEMVEIFSIHLYF